MFTHNEIKNKRNFLSKSCKHQQFKEVNNTVQTLISEWNIINLEQSLKSLAILVSKIIFFYL